MDKLEDAQKSLKISTWCVAAAILFFLASIGYVVYEREWFWRFLALGGLVALIAIANNSWIIAQGILLSLKK